MECRIRADLEQAIEKSRDLSRTLHDLRRSLRKCDACELGAGICPIWQNFNAEVEAAIRQVLREWELL